MARVVASIKIYPQDVIISVDEIKKGIMKALPQDVQVHQFVEEPIAYGLVALIVHLILPEAEGQIEKVENALQAVEGVGQIEVQMVRRV
jgi:translation elongation factor aEF-1 beta